jgi:hypothetical protein
MGQAGSVKPNFFIVGAPKCGTTAMAEYLRAHPDVYMPECKELHFFGSDVSRNITDEAEYLSLFQRWRVEARAGEASVFYLHSQAAAHEIKAFSPEVRIIVMLRNPVDAMYSLYSQNRFNSWEDLPTFEAALAAEPERRAGRGIQPHVRRVEALRYREVYSYTEQLRRYFDAFGREAVHVIIFDDFKADTASAYRATLAFLGVDTAFRPNLHVVHTNKRARSVALGRFLQAPPAWYRALKVVGRAALPGDWGRHVRQRMTLAVRDLNAIHEPRTPMDPATRRQLQEEMCPEVERLGELLGRDLTHWCREHEAR